MLRTISIVVLTLLFFRSNAQTGSVLSSGDWYRLAVVNDGIYKIDHSFLISSGLDPQSLDPREIAIFGNGGGILPQENSAPRPSDLQELSIFVSGEDDGIFDPGDFILFFAEGPDKWKYDPLKGMYIEEENIYSDTSFYFLLARKGSQGKRLEVNSPALTSSDTVRSFTERISFEQDLYNMYRSGREWFGDMFRETKTRSYTFPLPGLVPDSDIKINTTLMGRSQVSTSFRLDINGTRTDSVIFDYYGWIYYTPLGELEQITTIAGPDVHNNLGQIDLTLNYDGKGNSTSEGYLDAFDINYRKALDLSSENLLIVQHSEIQGEKILEISGVSGKVHVWEITDPGAGSLLEGTLTGDKIHIRTETGSEKKFVIFREYNFPAPEFKGTIENQDLHSLSTPDFLIITHPKFLHQAQDLADFRRSNDNMAVEVVTTEQVYNEFSSGKPDVTAIRDFIRYLYLRSTEGDSLKYLLLFGNASYDYKDRAPDNTNYVPTYQSRNSVEKLKTYGSDDYYGFMDENEGYWDETTAGNAAMEIGIGRFPVSTTEEADNIINKIKEYHTSPEALGKWRSRITLVSDDGDNNLHQKDNEKHGAYIETNHSVFNLEKVYVDRYTQAPDSLGLIRSPETRERINTIVNEGTLILNYVGHGGYNGVSSEDIMNHKTLSSWRNKGRYAFFITATCEFGRYDDPSKFSLGQALVVQQESAGISIITGTRSAFSTANYSFNYAILRSIFHTGNRLGDVIRETKNNSLMNVYNRHVIMLGDPSIVLEYPSENVVLNTVNGVSDFAGDTLNALKMYAVNGSVLDSSGVKISTFEGTAEILVYDKQEIIKTKGFEANSPAMDLTIREKVLHKGFAPVTGGDFEFSFILPANAADSIGSAKVYLYARPADGTLDAHGAEFSLSTGGLDENAPTDSQGPSIAAYIDTVTFVSGDTVSHKPVLNAYLSDEHGLNTSDNYLISLLNSDSTILLHEYFHPDTGDFTGGTVIFPFESLPEGEYTLKITAWDTYNNPSESTLEFVVKKDFLSPVFQQAAQDFSLTAFPNPFKEETSFMIDLPGGVSGSSAEVIIYSISGVPVTTFSQPVSGGSRIRFRPEEHGISLQPGLYVCQFTIHSPGSGKTYQSAVVIVRH